MLARRRCSPLPGGPSPALCIWHDTRGHCAMACSFWPPPSSSFAPLGVRPAVSMLVRGDYALCPCLPSPVQHQHWGGHLARCLLGLSCLLCIPRASLIGLSVLKKTSWRVGYARWPGASTDCRLPFAVAFGCREAKEQVQSCYELDRRRMLRSR